MITQASLIGVHDRMTYKPLLVFKLSDQKTIGEAARWIRDNGMPEPGAFIDCEYLRGEKDEPMTFEDEFDYCPWKD